VAHRAGGAIIAEPSRDPIHVCFLRTGAPSWEPTIGITGKGTVLVYPDYELTPVVNTSVATVNAVRPGVSISTDEGASWNRSASEVETPRGDVATHQHSLDPYMYVDPHTSRIFADDLTTQHCSVLSISDDEGETWRDSLAGCFESDHQTVFAGPPRDSIPIGYPNVVYRCAVNTVAASHASFTSTCQKSLDGGLTFLPPGTPAYIADPQETGHGDVPGYCDGGLGHGIVDHAGRVWLPKGFCGQPWVAFSDDEGLTWTRVQVATNGMNDEGGPGVGIGTVGVHTRAFAHEAAIGVDPEGNAYYAWVAADRLPYLSISTDRGATWGAPLMIGAPGVNEASLPALAVGGVGKVTASYMGTTNSPGDRFDGDYSETTWHGYLMVMYNANDAQPVFFSSAVNAPDDPLEEGECGAIRCGVVGDFIDVQIGPDGVPWAAYVDGHADVPQESVVGRFWGGPSLWDDADPNGPYPAT
jgi:hypothetical protein